MYLEDKEFNLKYFVFMDNSSLHGHNLIKELSQKFNI